MNLYPSWFCVFTGIEARQGLGRSRGDPTRFPCTVFCWRLWVQTVPACLEWVGEGLHSNGYGVKLRSPISACSRSGNGAQEIRFNVCKELVAWPVVGSCCEGAAQGVRPDGIVVLFWGDDSEVVLDLRCLRCHNPVSIRSGWRVWNAKCWASKWVGKGTVCLGEVTTAKVRMVGPCTISFLPSPVLLFTIRNTNAYTHTPGHTITILSALSNMRREVWQTRAGTLLPLWQDALSTRA